MPSSADSRRWASTTCGGPLCASLPLLSRATRGVGLPEIAAAYADPMTAKLTRSRAEAVTVAPTSSSNAKGSSLGPWLSSVGVTAASAARDTPGMRPRPRAAARIAAPVEPAVTRALARPSDTT